MSAILDLIRHHRVRRFETGEAILEQGSSTGMMYVLLEGEVEVLKDDLRVAKASDPGVVFGEMSALLGVPHTASIRALRPSRLAIIEDPCAFLESSPRACVEVAVLLARRLDSVTRYLVDVKQQYEGHDHLAMVDTVLDSLIHRHPRGQPP